jgi:hypothetical protein
LIALVFFLTCYGFCKCVIGLMLLVKPPTRLASLDLETAYFRTTSEVKNILNDATCNVSNSGGRNFFVLTSPVSKEILLNFFV